MDTYRNTYNRKMQGYVEDYIRKNGDGPVDPHDIADWLLEQKLWQAPYQDVRNLLSKDISQAMRTQYTLDEHGRKVRRKHSLRIKEAGAKQMVLWCDVEFATPDFMMQSLQQRRGDIADRCWQITKDSEFYNKKYNKAASIQIHMDFREDVEERRASDGDSFPGEDEA